MRSMVLLVAAAFLTVAGVKAEAVEAAATNAAASAKAKVQTTCPVMGGAINKAIFVDKEGERIYLCCRGCEAAVKKDFATYKAKLEKEGVTLAKVPVEDKGALTAPAPQGK